MGIELMQDGSPSEARAWLKKFNTACKDALKGKPTKSAFENNDPAVRFKKLAGITEAGGTGVFEPGDKYSNDFDYTGMLESFLDRVPMPKDISLFSFRRKRFFPTPNNFMYHLFTEFMV